MSSVNAHLGSCLSYAVQKMPRVHIWTLFPGELPEAILVVQSAGLDYQVMRLQGRDQSFALPCPDLLFAWLPHRNEQANFVALQLLQTLVDSETPVLLAVDAEAVGLAITYVGGSNREIIVRPVSSSEFNARVAILRARTSRRARTNFDPYEFGPNLMVEVAGKVVELQQIQYYVALHLFRNAGRIVGREELRSLFWPQLAKSSRAIDVAVSKIRSQLGLHAGARYVLRSIRGRGYMLECAGG